MQEGGVRGGGRSVNIKYKNLQSSASSPVSKRRILPEGNSDSFVLCLNSKIMDFGLDFTDGNVPDMSTFCSGHYWSSTRLDMKNDDYAQDSSKGEYLTMSFYQFQSRFRDQACSPLFCLFTCLQYLKLSLKYLTQVL